MKVIYLKINQTTGVIKDLAGNLITDGSIKVTHKDDVAFAAHFVEVDENGVEQNNDLSNETTIRLAGDTHLAEDADAVFTQADYNQGIVPAFEDDSIGKVIHLVHLTSDPLNTHMGSQPEKTIIIEWSISGPGPDFYNSTLANLEITVQAGVHQNGNEVIVSPDPSYLTAAEIQTLIDTAVENAIDLLDEDDMASDSDTQGATQQSIRAYVLAQITNLIDSSPAALDTLAELAASLGDDDDFAGTMVAALAGKHSNTADIDLTDTYILKAVLGIGVTAATNKTIISGTFTQTQFAHKMLNEGATATDDLVSVTPATNQKLLLLTMGNSGQVPTIKHGTGTNQFSLQDDTDLVCKNNAAYLFWLDGTVWKLVGGSGSGGGSGGGGGYQHSAVVTIDHTDSPYAITASDLGKLIEIDPASTADVTIICDPAVLSDREKWVKLKCRIDQDNTKGIVEVDDDTTDTFDDHDTEFRIWKGERAVLIMGDDNNANNMDTEGGGSR